MDILSDPSYKSNKSLFDNTYLSYCERVTEGNINIKVADFLVTKYQK